MSVEPTDKIQEEDESANSLSRPSTVDNSEHMTTKERESIEKGKAVNGGIENVTNGKDEESSNLNLNLKSDQVEDSEYFSYSNNSILQESSDIVNQFRDPINGLVSVSNEKVETSEDNALIRGSDEDAETSTRHGTKRSHQRESDEFESTVEKMKSAYQLMGLMYDLKDTNKIRKASVCYKKRFSQIRFQNRILRLQKPPNKHIYFDDDDEPCNSVKTHLKAYLLNLPQYSLDDLTKPTISLESPTSTEIQDRNTSGELFEGASEENTAPTLREERRKLEMEEFSEKDDSTDDDQDIFFSAEEDNLDDGQERKLKNLPKRRKKRQMKKKMISYPQEMVDNPKIKKFWRRRYSLFSKYDEGIKMDAESWYSVTPEKIAINIAQRCQCDLIVDAFCGAGGNAIQLAFTCERVIAIDIDPHKIELARHNARVYGVEDRIEFIVGDYLQVAPSLTADAVFLSPPWGGPGYSRHNVFPLSSLLPVSGQELFRVTSAITDNIAFYLPRNINTQELVECAGPGGCVEVVQNFLDRELIAVTAYFDELVNSTV